MMAFGHTHSTALKENVALNRHACLCSIGFRLLLPRRSQGYRMRPAKEGIIDSIAAAGRVGELPWIQMACDLCYKSYRRRSEAESATRIRTISSRSLGPKAGQGSR